MKILIIEDDKEINEALKEGLEDESYAVDSCLDGEDGYHTAMAEEYDLIILDVMLPSMNGFEVCQKLRAEKKYDTNSDADGKRTITGYGEGARLWG